MDSRNSSILGMSVNTSPSKSTNGGFVPGAMSASSLGLVVLSTVVTLNYEKGINKKIVEIINS